MAREELRRRGLRELRFGDWCSTELLLGPGSSRLQEVHTKTAEPALRPRRTPISCGGRRVTCMSEERMI